MRRGVLVASSVVAVAIAIAPVSAEPRLEGSGFVGVGFLPSDVQLGDSWAPEQVPGNAPLVGLRLTGLLAPHLVAGDGHRLQLAFEAEADLAAASTRSSPARDGRMTYFAPVLGWRGHLMLRYVDDRYPLWPHVVVGAGGATVASESPYMRKESDPLAYYGGGVTLPLTRTWHVRIDARHGVMAARGGGTAQVAELQFGFGGTFGLAAKHVRARPVEPPAPQPVVDETDSDGDGLPDHIDRCPARPETINGFDDDDGCPEPDTDADGVLGDADRCPDLAEDRDGYQDADGCPDPDNDRDGVDDVRDRCPLEPETRNGFDDDDGCPDGLPPELGKPLAIASAKLTFEPNRARVTDAGQKVLAPVLELLLARKTLRVVIAGRPSSPQTEDLARRRADAVKWYLIDQGVAQERFQTRVLAPGKGTAVELTLGE